MVKPISLAGFGSGNGKRKTQKIKNGVNLTRNILKKIKIKILMSDIFLNMHYNPETKNRQSKRKSGFKEELQPTCTQRLSTFHSIQIQPDNLLHHYNMQQPNSLSHPRHRAIQAPTCKQDHRTQHTPVKCHLHRATLQPHHQHQPKKPTTLITYILESNQAYRHLIPLHLHFLSSHPFSGSQVHGPKSRWIQNWTRLGTVQRGFWSRTPSFSRVKTFR